MQFDADDISSSSDIEEDRRGSINKTNDAIGNYNNKPLEKIQDSKNEALDTTVKNGTHKSQDLSKVLNSANKEETPSKFLIPPPIGLPFKPRAVEPTPSSAYDDDPDKKKFLRFIKMVERKNEATSKVHGVAAA